MFALFPFSLFVLREYARSKKLLQKALEKSSIHFSPTEIKRLHQLMLFSVAATYPYIVLRGKKLTAAERKSISFLGAATALCDDLADEYQYTLEDIANLLKNGILKDSQHKKERFCLYLFQSVMEDHPHSSLFWEKLYRALEAQERSKKQENADLSTEEIWEISCEKGGLTNVVFRYFLHHLPTAEEEKMAYQWGICLQMLDDLFDLYEDLEAKIRTPVSSATNLEQLRALFESEKKKTFVLLEEFSGSKRQKRRIKTIFLYIFSRANIAFDQYAHFCKKTKQNFPPAQYSRKDLIVDMEKPGNFIRNILDCFREG